MKRIGFIYEKICDIDNIKKAIKNASKGKKKRKYVADVNRKIGTYATIIQGILLSKTYIPGIYNKSTIIDKNSNKERIIYKSKFYPDQIIQWALMQQIENILYKGAYYYSCACIKGRGIMHGMKYIKTILVEDKKYTKYCLKIDIKKFYPSINKEILKRKFERKIKDKDTLDLIFKIVDSCEQGIPIGNYTSQWFANFYLQDLDHYIKEELKIKHYIRYMDDMVLFSNNKRNLHKIKLILDNYLNKESLVIKENWQVFKVDSRPLDFLGYRFYRGYTTLRRCNFLRIRRRVKKIYKKKELTYKDSSAVMSYYGWIKHCDSYNYNQKNLKPYVNIYDCKEVIRNESRKQSSASKKI